MVQDAVAAKRGIGRGRARGRAQRRGTHAATRITVEDRRRRAAAVMVRDFRKGRLGRLTFDITA